MQGGLNGCMRPNNLDTFGQRLRYARTLRGMTQAQLAQAAGEKQGTISKIELGKIASPGNAVGLARALRVSADWLALNIGPSGLEDTSAEPATSGTSPEASELVGSLGSAVTVPPTAPGTWHLAMQGPAAYRAMSTITVRQAVITLGCAMQGLSERSRRNLLKILGDLVDKPEEASDIAAEAEAYISASKQFSASDGTPRESTG